jgi:hypothetical protein
MLIQHHLLPDNGYSPNKSLSLVFTQPHEINEKTSIHTLIPEFDNIPDDFEKRGNKWHKAVLTWFFAGINKEKFSEKAGIDKEKAISHLSVLIGDWTLKHNHKIAGAAFLMSLWFEDFAL